MTVIHDIPDAEETSVTGDHTGRTRTESIAWALFVAGYDARLADARRGTRFLTRDSFEEHLSERFWAAYTDS